MLETEKYEVLAEAYFNKYPNLIHDPHGRMRLTSPVSGRLGNREADVVLRMDFEYP